MRQTSIASVNHCIEHCINHCISQPLHQPLHQPLYQSTIASSIASTIVVSSGIIAILVTPSPRADEIVRQVARTVPQFFGLGCSALHARSLRKAAVYNLLLPLRASWFWAQLCCCELVEEDVADSPHEKELIQVGGVRWN